jgi:hypothetical protein
MRYVLASFAISLFLSSAALADAKELNACYSNCNKTVADKAKRNACFKECKSGAGSSASAPKAAAEPGPARRRASLAQRKCYSNNSCAARFTPSEQEACYQECDNNAKVLTNSEREQAVNAQSRAASQLGGNASAQCKKQCSSCGKGGDSACLSSCNGVIGKYNQTRGILSAASKIGPGQSGYLSGKQKRTSTGQVYNELDSAKRGLDISWSSCRFNDASENMDTIQRSWNESLAASRRRGD